MSMHHYGYNSYDQERKRRRAEWEQALKECPHCHTPINQHFSEYGSDKPRHHCGSDRCRKAASRANLAERKRQQRSQTRANILHWCDTWLDAEQHRCMMEMTDLLMGYDYQHGHELAAQVVKVIDEKRCQHDRIHTLLDNASAAKRRADKAEEYNQQLERLYKERIYELEAEIHVYQLLENVVHNIATRQLEKQPDQEPNTVREPEDEDRTRVLATLKQAGIRPIEEALADGREPEEDDTEGHGYDVEEEDPEE